MNRKTRASYVAVFQYIEDNIFRLNPASFTTDYEQAMRTALTEIYPLAKFLACWFHYTQALRRKSSQIKNFFKEISKNKKLDRIYHMFLALPLLPSNRIREAFNMLKMTIDCLQKINVFHDFLIYFERQWLQKVYFLKTKFLIIRISHHLEINKIPYEFENI